MKAKKKEGDVGSLATYSYSSQETEVRSKNKISPQRRKERREEIQMPKMS